MAGSDWAQIWAQIGPRYIEVISLAAILTTKRLAGVEPEEMYNTYMTPPSVNKAEPTLALKPRGDVQNRGISGTTKNLSSNNIFKNWVRKVKK